MKGAKKKWLIIYKDTIDFIIKTIASLKSLI